MAEQSIEQTELLNLAWEDPWLGWARNHTNKVWYKIERHYGEKEDAIQDCAVKFFECQIKYKGEFKRPQFMGYFKTAVTNHYTTIMTNNRVKVLNMIDSESDYLTPGDDGEEVSLLENLPDTGIADPDRVYSNMNYVLEHADSELRSVLHTLMNAPAEAVDLIARFNITDSRLAHQFRQVMKLPGKVRIYDELEIDLPRDPLLAVRKILESKP